MNNPVLRGNGATFGSMAKRTELELTMTSLILLPWAWAARTLPDQVRCPVLTQETGLRVKATRTGFLVGATRRQGAATALLMATISRMETPLILRATMWEREDCLAVPLPPFLVTSSKTSRGRAASIAARSDEHQDEERGNGEQRIERSR